MNLPQSQNKKSFMIPVVIIVAAVIATIMFHQSAKKLDDEILSAQNDKEISDTRLKIYKDIYEHYGRASDEFYAEKPVIVLRGRGTTESVRIYHQANENGITAYRNTDVFDTSWVKDENDESWSDFKITSKVNRAYETIEFEDKVTKEIFSVLVIVK